MRILLFLAVLGVVTKGMALDPTNPAASAFQQGAGTVGYRIFGLVLFSAALTSIIGSAYTSVSFLNTLSPFVAKNFSKVIIAFITVSTLIFVILGKAAKLQIIAGALNGLILPITLGTILIASTKTEIVKNYKHSKWLLIAGVVAVIIGVVGGVNSLSGIVKLWQ
jgi:Mn2+/Fe2+ NRAMP family transporter